MIRQTLTNTLRRIIVYKFVFIGLELLVDAAAYGYGSNWKRGNPLLDGLSVIPRIHKVLQLSSCILEKFPIRLIKPLIPFFLHVVGLI